MQTEQSEKRPPRKFDFWLPHLTSPFKLNKWQTFILLGIVGLLSITATISGILLIIYTSVGPFTEILILVVVPLIVIPCVIIGTRASKYLLRQYNITQKRVRLSRESRRQRVSIFVHTSPWGVSWVGEKIYLARKRKDKTH
jgi:ABC-type multidrug transport system fused ATPase/permease subunit